MRYKPTSLLPDFMFLLLCSSENFGAPSESIAKSDNAHCDKENLASTFGKVRKRRVSRNQDRPDKWQALADCPSPSRGFAHTVREIASRIELNLPHAPHSELISASRISKRPIYPVHLLTETMRVVRPFLFLGTNHAASRVAPPPATRSFIAASKATMHGGRCGKRAGTPQPQSARARYPSLKRPRCLKTYPGIVTSAVSIPGFYFVITRRLRPYIENRLARG
jgi:hypothetical protein